MRACVQVLSRRGAARVLVFCNKIETCRSVENHLRRADRDGSRFKVLVYHEAIRDELRAGFLNSFLQPVKPKELPVVLVATDRMSRGAHLRVLRGLQEGRRRVEGRCWWPRTARPQVRICGARGKRGIERVWE